MKREALAVTNRIDAADHGEAVRSSNRHQFVGGTPAGAGRDLRVTRDAGGGFDWHDASIGAGLTAALLLGAVRVASLRRRPTLPAH